MVVNSPLAPTPGVASYYAGRAARRILFCGLLVCPPRPLLTCLALYVNGGVSVGLVVIFCTVVAGLAVAAAPAGDDHDVGAAQPFSTSRQPV